MKTLEINYIIFYRSRKSNKIDEKSRRKRDGRVKKEIEDYGKLCRDYIKQKNKKSKMEDLK